MAEKPQEICDDMVSLAKDRVSLLVSLGMLSEYKRKCLSIDLKELKDNSIPSEKKLKLNEKVQTDKFINDLKRSIKDKISHTKIEYAPTDY
jgi:hypothetical protein